MDRKNRVFIQTMICIGIFATVRGTGMFGGDEVAALQKKAEHLLSCNYTLSDIQEKGKDVVTAVASAPAAVGKAVLQANKLSQYGEPIDQDAEKPIKTVHAVAGGKVLRAGIREDLGMYVSILHQDKISTYGNLQDLTVVSGDRVKKGDILGSYDEKKNEAFYYSLEDRA